MTNKPYMVGSWTRGFSLCIVLALLTTFAPTDAAQAKSPLGQGQIMPDLELALPSQANQAAYLGLKPAAGKTFRLGQIKQPWVLIEIFNMYCTICQGEASRVNQLYESLSQDNLKDKIAMIGIGVGNSDFEVKVFRNRYGIKFPLFADSGFKAHKALDEPRTPYFLLVRVREPKLRIALTNLGPFGEVSNFLADLQKVMNQE